MLDLLCCREMPPAGRKVGNARHVWESENAAVVSANAEFTLSFERGACHGSGMWRALSVEASTGSSSRARVQQAGFPEKDADFCALLARPDLPVHESTRAALPHATMRGR